MSLLIRRCGGSSYEPKLDTGTENLLVGWLILGDTRTDTRRALYCCLGATAHVDGKDLARITANEALVDVPWIVRVHVGSELVKRRAARLQCARKERDGHV